VPLPVLLGFTGAVRSLGSISQAAIGAGMSYRHAWGLLRSSTSSSAPSWCTRSRGQGTVLSPLADKADLGRQAHQRPPQPPAGQPGVGIAAGTGQLLAERPPALRLTASHGFAVAALVERSWNEQDVLVDLSTAAAPRRWRAGARRMRPGRFPLAGRRVEGAAAAKYLPWLDPGATC
jgi:hypothetical protein